MMEFMLAHWHHHISSTVIMDFKLAQWHHHPSSIFMMDFMLAHWHHHISSIVMMDFMLAQWHDHVSSIFMMDFMLAHWHHQSGFYVVPLALVRNFIKTSPIKSITKPCPTSSSIASQYSQPYLLSAPWAAIGNVMTCRAVKSRGYREPATPSRRNTGDSKPMTICVQVSQVGKAEQSRVGQSIHLLQMDQVEDSHMGHRKRQCVEG